MELPNYKVRENEFCLKNGDIDWNKLVEYNSENKR